ncbi:hypothetical protein PMAYCL1PPCAC_24837, partial [Pristionchus mayeri]
LLVHMNFLSFYNERNIRTRVPRSREFEARLASHSSETVHIDPNFDIQFVVDDETHAWIQDTHLRFSIITVQFNACLVVLVVVRRNALKTRVLRIVDISDDDSGSEGALPQRGFALEVCVGKDA